MNFNWVTYGLQSCVVLAESVADPTVWTQPALSAHPYAWPISQILPRYGNHVPAIALPFGTSCTGGLCWRVEVPVWSFAFHLVTHYVDPRCVYWNGPCLISVLRTSVCISSRSWIEKEIASSSVYFLLQTTNAKSVGTCQRKLTTECLFHLGWYEPRFVHKTWPHQRR